MYTIFLYLVARSTPIRRGDMLVLVWSHKALGATRDHMIHQYRDLPIQFTLGHLGARTNIKISSRLIGVERATSYRGIVYIDFLELVLLFSKF